jgi:hypothetical protein
VGECRARSLAEVDATVVSGADSGWCGNLVGVRSSSWISSCREAMEAGFSSAISLVNSAISLAVGLSDTWSSIVVAPQL